MIGAAAATCIALHLRGINEHLGTSLTPSEMAELRRIMTKLKAGIHATNTTDTYRAGHE